jgi:lipid-A-disaccharide synthase
MKSALFAIAKSGTVTLELALHSVPTCVTYAVGKIDIFIAQKLLGVNLPFYSLPNILCEEKVYPELIGPFFTMDNLKAEAELLLESSQREKQKKQLAKIRKLLGERHASRSAAEHVHQALESSTTCYN